MTISAEKMPKLTAMDMLKKVEERWLELEARDISSYDFRCLMTDVSNFISEESKSAAREVRP